MASFGNFKFWVLLATVFIYIGTLFSILQMNFGFRLVFFQKIDGKFGNVLVYRTKTSDEMISLGE